jgi:hypothetical protein
LGLVTLPADNRTRITWVTISPSEAADALQGQLGPLIALTLWLLSVTQAIPRAWFYFLSYIITSISSLRAFVAIATQRISALKKVAVLQSEIRGTIEDKTRRNRIWKQKQIGVVIDLFASFGAMVLPGASLVLLRSSFSSRQHVIHLCVLQLVLLPPIIAGLVALRTSLQRSKKRKEMTLTFKIDSNARSRTLSSSQRAVSVDHG